MLGSEFDVNLSMNVLSLYVTGFLFVNSVELNSNLQKKKFGGIY